MNCCLFGSINKLSYDVCVLISLSRHRSKSVTSKEKSSEAKRPEITLVLPPDDAAKNSAR